MHLSQFIYYMVSDPVLAEDLTQETFIRVYKGRFRNEAAMGTYIRRIARNLVYDTYNIIVQTYSIYKVETIKISIISAILVLIIMLY
ncbi:sigma factor [Lysinibacillus sp. Ag94]|uniref:sigma factor n=1 Tax=Lysinibacillus sp. Ag94 TaxID=2936682 RepID=UPI003530D276